MAKKLSKKQEALIRGEKNYRSANGKNTSFILNVLLLKTNRIFKKRFSIAVKEKL